MNGRWKLVVRSEFSAAHALRNYHGKCERLHGHNFGVSLCVEGRQLDCATGMLLDFSILKRILKECVEELDHGILNEKAPFDSQNPSSENLAHHIAEIAQKKLEELPEAWNVKLISVKVSEKPTQEAEYILE